MNAPMITFYTQCVLPGVIVSIMTIILAVHRLRRLPKDEDDEK